MAAALTDNGIKSQLLDYYTFAESNAIVTVPPPQVGISDKMNTPGGLLQGLDTMLNNPHVYPQSARGTHPRHALQQLWATDCPYKDVDITWGAVVQMAIRYLWKISLALPDTQVLSHRVLFGEKAGARADDAICIMRNQYPAYILWTILFRADKGYPMFKPVYAKPIMD
jgi:hypothetical protein